MDTSPSDSFLWFHPDGYLKAYEWANEWQEVKNVLTETMNLSECGYCTICGNYSICSNGQCTCPQGIDGETSYFIPLDDREPDQGCSKVTPLSCQSSQFHSFLELKDVTYFTNAA
uniref:Uncharacterized protein n=1 Tax=Nelumbo nucifera TaxID=4432 RepID=A0A822Y1D4_NELNU|nr:TPA_asm: hypothetical protein HUJ06_027261 [Nelumbo nucifera]